MSGPEIDGTPVAVAVLRRWFDAINAAEVDELRRMVGAGYLHHSGAGDLDPDAVLEGFRYYKAAFPDLTYDVEEILALDGGGGAIARWTMRGTNLGAFHGAAPTGRTIASPGLSLHRIVDGTIVEEWEFNDDLGLVRGLGFSLRKPEDVAPPGGVHGILCVAGGPHERSGQLDAGLSPG